MKHAAAVLFLVLCGPAVHACGHCVEDRIAAVYDHALLQRTTAQRQQIVFFAWEGKPLRGEASRRRMAELASGAAGVIPGSVRVSMEPAALAVAFDPRRGSVDALEAALRKSLASMKLTLVRLQTPQAH